MILSHFLLSKAKVESAIKGKVSWVGLSGAVFVAVSAKVLEADGDSEPLC